MPFLASVGALGEADVGFVNRCSWEGALRYCVQRSGMDDFEVADEIPISHGYMCKVLKGTAGLWGRRLVKFMLATQCIAPLQWIAEQVGCDVVQRDPQQAEINRLRAALEAAERSVRRAAA
jgi:hypothetical protein